jgi:putative NADH-flavin reductase
MIKNVLLLGADGNLGPFVLNALVDADFNVTVMKRASSKSKSSYPESVKEIRVSDDFPAYELSEILTGQDAVVITIPGSNTQLQTRLAAAAVNAGVKHFIPADFGSCDSDSKRAQELVPLYVEKALFRKYLTNLAEKNPGFSWTSLVPGHFFDWEPKFLHINIKEHQVDYLDEGEDRWSTSTLGQISKATVKVLQSAEKPEVRNKMLYIQSFCVTQQMVHAACEKATGTQWKVKKYDSAPFTKEQKAAMDAGDHDATEEVVWVLGTLEAYWEDKKDFAMDLLGLEEENLDEVIKRIVSGAE